MHSPAFQQSPTPGQWWICHVNVGVRPETTISIRLPLASPLSLSQGIRFDTARVGALIEGHVTQILRKHLPVDIIDFFRIEFG